ncbi:MAG: glycosyltransferase family 87 protein [Alphaproteobacteria bacterium]
MTLRVPSPSRLLWLWTLLGLALFVGPYLFFFAPVDMEHDRQSYLLGRDFVNVWFGAKQALAGKTGHIFKTKEYLADMRGLLGADYPRHNFSYPPHILPLILLFGVAPYFWSLFLWTAAGLGCFAAALKKNPFLKLGWPALLLTALSPAAIFNGMFGQNGAFTAAFFLGGLYLCEASPVLAGILFGLLTVKPHLGVLIPLVLLLRRNWKCFSSATATTGALVVIGVLIWGVQPWRDYLTDTLPYQSEFLNGPYRIFNPLMPGVWSDIMHLIPGEDWGYVIYAAIAVFAVFVAVAAVLREGITARSVLVIALSTICILPYGFNYDMVAVAGALAIYLATQAELRLSTFIAMGLLWMLPLALVQFRVFPLPFSGAILLSALISLHLSARASGISGTHSGDSYNRPSTGAGPPAVSG